MLPPDHSLLVNAIEQLQKSGVELPAKAKGGSGAAKAGDALTELEPIFSGIESSEVGRASIHTLALHRLRG